MTMIPYFARVKATFRRLGSFKKPMPCEQIESKKKVSILSLERVTKSTYCLRCTGDLRLTANSRNDHVTMFILHLPLAVFSVSVKLGSFALASKARIVLYYSHPCTHRLPFAINVILNLSIVSRPANLKTPKDRDVLFRICLF